jgi:hypothetical protein
MYINHKLCPDKVCGINFIKYSNKIWWAYREVKWRTAYTKTNTRIIYLDRWLLKNHEPMTSNDNDSIKTCFLFMRVQISIATC